MDRNVREPSVLVTVSEACRMLHLSRGKVYALMADGELPFVKLGKSRRVPVAALQDLIARHTHGARGANHGEHEE